MASTKEFGGMDGYIEMKLNKLNHFITFNVSLSNNTGSLT